ncbi:MAG: galactose-1-phosphate uridylyltransferase [bacterium]
MSAYRQRTLLADGRELIYYDDVPGTDRSAPDTRDLPATASTSQIRWDPLFAEWAVVAGHRQSRTYKPPTDECPLDPSRPGRPTEIPAPDYDVVVFENRFPSLSVGAAEAVAVVDDGPFRTRPGVGRCEVVCFTSDHNTAFAQLPPKRVRTVFDAWVDRTLELSAIDGVEYVFCFENRGEEIGVTLSHPHGQIYAYPFVPPRLAVAARTAAAYEAEHGGCLQCSLLEQERADGQRVVLESEHFLAYVPFAARWPYEVTVAPKRHVPDLPGLDEAELDDLASVYLQVLQRFDGLFETPAPYIASWQQAPVHTDRDSWHLSASVFTIRRASGKLKYLAGSESGAAVWINDVLPEAAAQRLREVG